MQSQIVAIQFSMQFILVEIKYKEVVEIILCVLSVCTPGYDKELSISSASKCLTVHGLGIYCISFSQVLLKKLVKPWEKCLFHHGHPRWCLLNVCATVNLPEVNFIYHYLSSLIVSLLYIKVFSHPNPCFYDLKTIWRWICYIKLKNTNLNVYNETQRQN